MGRTQHFLFALLGRSNAPSIHNVTRLELKHRRGQVPVALTVAQTNSKQLQSAMLTHLSQHFLNCTAYCSSRCTVKILELWRRRSGGGRASSRASFRWHGHARGRAHLPHVPYRYLAQPLTCSRPHRTPPNPTTLDTMALIVGAVGVFQSTALRPQDLGAADFALPRTFSLSARA